jgi:hypothetical protein
MPSFNYFDDKVNFIKLCQTIEQKFVDPILKKNDVFLILRNQISLWQLKQDVINHPKQRPSKAFYFTNIGMTLTELAFYDLYIKMNR